MNRTVREPELDVPFKGVVFTVNAITVAGRASRRARLRHRRVLRAFDQAVLAARSAPNQVAGLLDEAARVAGVSREQVERALADTTPPLSAFEGLATLLNAIDQHDLPRALISDRPAPLGPLGGPRGWTAVVCGEQIAHLRPSTRLLEPIAETVGVPTSELVLVGEGPLDEALAEAAGCPLLLRGRDWEGLAVVGRKLLGGTWSGYTRQMRGSTMR